MLHSVTLWLSQLLRWYLRTEPTGAYLEHAPCGTRLLLISGHGPGTEYGVRIDSVVEKIAGHRCPALPPVTPQVVDGPLFGSAIGSASLSGSSASSPSPRPT